MIRVAWCRATRLFLPNMFDAQQEQWEQFDQWEQWKQLEKRTIRKLVEWNNDKLGQGEREKGHNWKREQMRKKEKGTMYFDLFITSFAGGGLNTQGPERMKKE